MFPYSHHRTCRNTTENKNMLKATKTDSNIVVDFHVCPSLNATLFSKRERITLRLLYAIAIPSVVCRL